MTRRRPTAILAACAALVAAMLAGVGKGQAPAAAAERCNPPETGITLPPGFCASVFADNLGHVRHMAMTDDGTIYVNTWSGRYYRNFPPVNGSFLVALKDSDGDGQADQILRFGPTAGQGNAGGDGIAVWHGFLYAETNDAIVRYPLQPGHLEPAGSAETVLSGMPLDGEHPMHPFAITPDGDLLVNMGAINNSCQVANRQANSPGIDPCPVLADHAGIWRYRADRTAQRFSAAERWATGIRNAGGISRDAQGRIYAVQHGRDQLGQNWGTLFSVHQGAELPSEELIELHGGDDFGWPYCYHDPVAGHLMLAPEYGGDGHTTGRCASKSEPVVGFPAHWAPNDVLAWHGGGFPRVYADGVFVAFHGSWNRAPEPQAGYQVVFQPLRDGRPAGAWIRFADGFAGGTREPGRAAHRPAGLLQGRDGALYIADDVAGRIWRVTWHGSADAPLTAAPEATQAAAAAVSGKAELPPGFTAEQVALGRRIFTGEARGGTCAGCHGSDGRGSSAGPALVGPTWLWSNGTVAGFAEVITRGVAVPKAANGAMPAKGGVDLSDDEVRNVAAYVWTLGHPG